MVRLADLGKFDVVLGTCCESLILGSNLESGLCSLNITLTCSDDGLQVVLALALSVSKNVGGSAEVAVEDVYESLVEAVRTVQLGSGVSILAVEDVNHCEVVLSLFQTGLVECGYSCVVVALAELYDTGSIIIIGVALIGYACESLLGLSILVQGEISYTEVDLGAVAVEFLNGLLVNSNLLVGVLQERTCTEKSLFVENLDVVVYESYELIVAVVGELYVGDESCAAELRKDVFLQDSVYLRHVLDLSLAYGGIAVHLEHSEDKVAVLDVRVGDEGLEAVPVLFYIGGVDVGLNGDVLVVDLLVEGVACSLGTSCGQLGVEILFSVG